MNKLEFLKELHYWLTLHGVTGFVTLDGQAIEALKFENGDKITAIDYINYNNLLPSKK